MTERGYIAVARGMLDHPVTGAKRPYSPCEAWLWLLFEAAWKERRIRVTNGWSEQSITLQRGQLTHSLRYMAKAWGWSTKRVKTFLNRLKKETQVETQDDAIQTVITICNYEAYQSVAASKKAHEETQKETQGKRKGNKEEEGNHLTKESMPVSDESAFDKWYATYPRKAAKQKAKKAFFRRIASKEISASDLQARTERFAAACAGQPEKERKFIPYPATYLNDGRYADEPEAGQQQADVIPFKPVAESTPDDWRRRVTRYYDKKEWLDCWGAPPGEPDCLAPQTIISETQRREGLK